MKHYVTYCATDEKIGSNPMWHSCLLLSISDEATNQMEVVDNWGFYGLPSTDKGTSIFTSILRSIKIKFGLDVDIVGNHGMLRHEEVRFMDVGMGLHGTTFELTEEQFNTLQKNCQQMAADQETAIKEIVPEGMKGKSPDKTRIYPYEDISPEIFKLEKILAEQQHREPRLKPFELNPSVSIWGPGFEHAKTCKSQVLALLKTVLTEKQINRLTEHGKHPTVPRYSGKMEDIYLHSTGPLRPHVKKSGDTVYSRDSSDKEVKLYWTLPPQEIEASEETVNRFKIDEHYCDDVKKIVGRLQRMEWLLRNAKVPEELKQVKEDLIQLTIKRYKGFFNIDAKPEEKNDSWFHSITSFFVAPKCESQADLRKKVVDSKLFLNALYMAMVENWTLDLKAPFELYDSAEEDVVEAESESEDVIDEDQDASSYENPIEALVAYLSVQDKKKLCEILGRTYCEREPEIDELQDALTPRQTLTASAR